MTAPHGDASSVHGHRAAAKRTLAAVVITVSDTRTLETDTGGALVAELLEGAGHRVLERRLVPDEADAIRTAVGAAVARDDVQVVLLTGGTGIAARDVTPEALEPLLDRVVPGFGELFRALSYQEIGSAAILSRALAGTARGRVVAALPGSRAAIRLALEKLLLPELPHLAAEATKRA
ncbi:MAG: molybdenum cofactor biosynthesis protein [Proteobacteria bacterium]|nr:MAG: molybdenum cofactor biosynthesis protein [Pseudomonadota bacterium]